MSDPNDDYLVPSSSGTMQSSMLMETEHIPPSPDKRNARHRLGDLLSGIRTGDINTFNNDDDENDDPDASRDSIRPPPVRERYPRERSSIITFELRSKPFQLRENLQEEGMYHLLRSWMHGRVNDEDPAEPEDTFATSPESQPNAPGSAVEESLDLMATKEIRRMPDPTLGEFEVPKMAIYSQLENERLGVGANVNDLRQEHLAGWRTARQQHQEYMAIREEKFAPSLQLLKTVHNITQETIQ
uniref:Similar to n=1 Tax=Panagrellus redivivus TaxID=6233 RepID=A0A7E4V5N2_PANRE